jgi:hypothetical protein
MESAPIAICVSPGVSPSDTMSTSTSWLDFDATFGRLSGRSTLFPASSKDDFDRLLAIRTV